MPRATSASRRISRPCPIARVARCRRPVAPGHRRHHQRLHAVHARQPREARARGQVRQRVRDLRGAGGAPPPVRLHRRRQRCPGVGGQLVPSRTRPIGDHVEPGGDAGQVAHAHERRHPATEGGQPAHPARAGDPEGEPAGKHDEQPGRDHDADQDRRGGAQRAPRPHAHRRADVPQHRPPQRGPHQQANRRVEVRPRQPPSRNRRAGRYRVGSRRALLAAYHRGRVREGERVGAPTLPSRSE